MILALYDHKTVLHSEYHYIKSHNLDCACPQPLCYDYVATLHTFSISFYCGKVNFLVHHSFLAIVLTSHASAPYMLEELTMACIAIGLPSNNKQHCTVKLCDPGFVSTHTQDMVIPGIPTS